MSSIMYEPDKHGVQIVGQYDVREPNWSFDIVLVVKSIETGRVYAAFDSGCSCPIPFEDHYFPSDFIEVKEWADVRRLIEEHRREASPIPASFRNSVLGALR